MRKILSFVLAAVMVLSLAVTAFAANVTLKHDNSPTEATTSALNAVYAAGILKGDGDKAPSASSKLTRWQVAVIALRVYTLVDYDGPDFCDLDDDNWANYAVDFGNADIKYADIDEVAYAKAIGAVLFAQEKGFIKGYEENGAVYFKPAQYVTYAEALALMVRILGWDSKAMNMNWPYNYVEQAAKLGLVEDIKGVGLDDEVTYGVFAQLIVNALGADIYFTVEELALFDQYSRNYRPDFVEFGEARTPWWTAEEVLSDLGTAIFDIMVKDSDGNYRQFAFDKANSTMNLGLSTDDYDLTVTNQSGNPTIEFTLIKNVGRLGNYLWQDKTARNPATYAPVSGADVDLEYYKMAYSGDEFDPNAKFYYYIFGEQLGGSVKPSTCYWSFYDLDEYGNPIEETRRPALTYKQKGAQNPSENAWYMQRLGTDTALVYEAPENEDYVVIVEVNGEYYFTHLDCDPLINACDAAWEEATTFAIIDAMIDKNDVALAAEIYTRNIWCVNLPLYGVPTHAVANNRSVDVLFEEYFGDMAKYFLISESSDALDEGGILHYVKANEVEYIDNAFVDYLGLANELGIVDFVYNLVYDRLEEELGQKAWDETLADYTMKNLKDYLAGINTDVDGLEFLGWSDPVYAGYYYDKDDKFNGDVIYITARYEEDYTTVEWVGAEKALGSYVVETKLENGYKTTTEYDHEFVNFNWSYEVDATQLSAEVEIIGTLNETTYGAWYIDTNGDNLYDVVVYANFVPFAE